MTAAELIQQLQTIHPETKVVVRGYEDGYNDIFVGVNVGLVKCFFAESNFPFSINGAFSLQTIVGDKSSMDQKPVSALGYGYTQTFFAHSRFYPFINISNSHDLASENHLFSMSLGINVKLD